MKGARERESRKSLVVMIAVNKGIHVLGAGEQEVRGYEKPKLKKERESK